MKWAGDRRDASPFVARAGSRAASSCDRSRAKSSDVARVGVVPRAAGVPRRSARSTGRCGAAWRSRSSSACGRSRSSRSSRLEDAQRPNARARVAWLAPRRRGLLARRHAARRRDDDRGLRRRGRARARAIAESRARVATLVRAGAARGARARRAVARRTARSPASRARDGAIVKLAINNPFLTPDEKLADYTQNLRYAIFRNLEYHFTDWAFVDCIVPVARAPRARGDETRRYAALLLWQVVSWLAARRAERTGALAERALHDARRRVAPRRARRSARARSSEKRRAPVDPSSARSRVAMRRASHRDRASPARHHPRHSSRVDAALACGAAVALALCDRGCSARPIVVAALLVANDHQVAKMRDQKWFFGRASRNIRDQHIRAGDAARASCKPHRVLVGDAGALVYASDRPGLDIIGLGGYHDLPFARAGVHGLAASSSSSSACRERDRPDVFAIYPSWWGTLPTWFSSDVLARIPAQGNVICGGYEDVIYQADWHVLGTGGRCRASRSVRCATRSTSPISSAKKSTRYTYSRGSGWTDMKILPDLADERLDVFDGGRILYAHATEHFTLRNFERARARAARAPHRAHGRDEIPCSHLGRRHRDDHARTSRWLGGTRRRRSPQRTSRARSKSKSKTTAPASFRSSTRGSGSAL